MGCRYGSLPHRVSTEPFPVCGTVVLEVAKLGRDRRGVTEKSGGLSGSMHQCKENRRHGRYVHEKLE